MLNPKEVSIIFNLASQGFTVSQIAQQTGRSIGTIYNYLRQQKHGEKESRESYRSDSDQLEHFREYLDTRIKLGITNSSKLYHELLSRGYSGNYNPIHDYLKKKNSNDRYKASRHVVTPPGYQAQVDWGYFGKIFINGKLERLYAFVYVLSYSRALYLEFVVRQDQQTLQQCHIHAFEKLGIPKEIVYDNMKTVVIGRDIVVLMKPEPLFYINSLPGDMKKTQRQFLPQ